ncbi:pyridoxal-phosphate dependent enzyme [Chitinophaga nivalis]|uniref:Pyridoxal-phosphate dependent enzyme n=1 Tax=Chitinophaga nivalis TaxID=2991709 RepID=A0ABT3IGW8_9BACT|nr:pyridoxal-phosphate dependent enzyme [Chitinophaga nivalis]MCW3467117.1 pyridoxal-phosphate dependent enzyme [Chitinophaga nivalis]MCW3483192.1 pyridoxal-phosphate dependent enzyme [Chitinophaga nivalis]
MLEELSKLSAFIGNTPLIRLNNEKNNLFAKLEYNNFSGSSKDRAAYSIIYHGIKSGAINEQTTIIASSSGNFAIAAASICRRLNIKFIPVIDPNINHSYELLLNMLAYKVVKVTERDYTGGYLLTRIDTVNSLHASTENSFIADQYADPNNFKGYYNLSKEVLQVFDRLDYIFIAVSSSGAITGISKSIKQERPDVKIVGVDVEGSVIFNQPPMKRFISGIGASKVPPIIEHAIIDDVVIVSQADIIKGSFELLHDQAIFAGASSGAVYLAAKNYSFPDELEGNANSLLIFPDKGHTYLDTIYNKEWGIQLSQKLQEAASLQ